MHILTVVGARPQFIKAAPVSRALQAAGIRETLLHTGQHYDRQMSQIFFEEMGIPEPAINLGVGSGSHAQQTGEALIGIEKHLLTAHPDVVLVYGDTNSTLAGALAAVKLGIPVAHVEAGLRSFNRTMPEEHNRILTDHCADWLFCPTETAMRHLANEGLAARAIWSGDVMFDAVLQFGKLAQHKAHLLTEWGLTPKNYLLLTIHRPYNTDDPHTLNGILQAVGAAGLPVVFPAHPRTHKVMRENGLHLPENIRLVEPQGYLEMLLLERNAAQILTDSGGVQKEAFFAAVPCITLRPETEWVETVASGWNVLAATPDALLAALQQRTLPQGEPPRIFGDGNAAEKIIKELKARYA